MLMFTTNIFKGFKSPVVFFHMNLLFCLFSTAKLVPVGYGINKLQLMCVVEDEKVSIDELCEQIQEFEDFVQSVDVAAMSKI